MANSSAVLSQMLCDAALENDVNGLRDLLSKDPFLLGRSSATTPSCYPLHIACKQGHLAFVRELISRSPALCEELDSNNSSPLHVASQNGHSDLIQPLVDAKPAMCFSRDVQGMTPFHLAAMNGYLPVLEELLRLAPVAAKERIGPVVGSVGGDTILHLCVKYNRLAALKTIIEEVGEAELLNAKNGDGNSILHLAVANKQQEIVEELLKENRLKKNTYNSNGWTATDIHLRSNKAQLRDDKKDEPKSEKTDAPTNDKDDELYDKLKEAGALPSNRTMTDKFLNRIESQRTALIVTASLIATIAFQAGINPPAGVWQDTQLNNSTTTAVGNTTHIAGLSIMAQQSGKYYNDFLAVNTMCLVSSVSSMVLLIFPLPPSWFALSVIGGAMTSSLFYMVLAYSLAAYSMKYGQRQSRVGLMLLIVLPIIGTLMIVTAGFKAFTEFRGSRGIQSRRPSVIGLVRSM